MASEIIEQTLMEQIAAMSLTGTAAYKIADALKVTRYRVHTILKSPEFKAHLRSLRDEANAKALAMVSVEVEKLAPLALSALKKNLEDNKIDAVKVYLELIGAKEKREETNQAGTLQVFLPGAVQPAEIKDVRSDVIDADNQSDRQDQ